MVLPPWSSETKFCFNSIKFNPSNDTCHAIAAEKEDTNKGILFVNSLYSDHGWTERLYPDHSRTKRISTAYAIKDCAWSESNENLLVAAGVGGYAQIFNLSKTDFYNPTTTFPRQPSDILSVAWNPNQRNSILAAVGNTVRICIAGYSGVPQISVYRGHTHSIKSVTWKPTDRNIFASASSDETLRIWDTRNASSQPTIVKADDDEILSCDWYRSDENFIATATLNRNYVKIWDIRQLRRPRKSPFSEGHALRFQKVKFWQHEEKMIAASSMDGSVIVWNYEKEAVTQKIYNHHFGISATGLDFNRKVKGLIASTGKNGLVRVWKYEPPQG